MAGRSTRLTVPRITRRRKGEGDVYATDSRMVPEETPIAFSYNGTTHAVMMASPADIEDFAIGFSLSEGIISKLAEISEIAIEDHGEGIDVQLVLADAAGQELTDRRRRMAGPVGCGLCGIESIEQALKPVASVDKASLRLTPDDISQAVRLLSAMQPLHSETGAVHAAGFYVPGTGVVLAREDVGRHNALDKLTGALCLSGIKGETGAVVITSRISIEMVQKAAIAGASVLIAVSAPTALAIRTAQSAGMTLVALVRGNEFDVFTRPERISGIGAALEPTLADTAPASPNADAATSTLVQSPNVRLVQYG
ncbi:formate dehydrogenase accessory sulfurtransferase FdhD [Phyllobacterium sp. 628]|uniref:formate dehydrogenase accessory sulfurtransferase FdhD n=1 Tax=Phyllobacterium sp. 628 TaxID=2718938 RepID=UPI001662838E|nr:formate dehydrogenase accessory sulfurtransferase FdhD [Phyllobacterium sp. 628]QND52029.1 formate dehydrogenase accessory sulfurtransferase FdhD [Phyllobacterium sp. 628]